MVRYALRIGVPVSLGSVGYYTLEGALRESVARYLAGGATLPTVEGDAKATKTTDTVFPSFLVVRPSTQYAATLQWLDRRGVRWASGELRASQKQPDAEELENSHSQARSGDFLADASADFGREPLDDPYQRRPQTQEPAPAQAGPLASEPSRASTGIASSRKAEDEELEFALAIRRGRGHHSIREAREVPNASELPATPPGGRLDDSEPPVQGLEGSAQPTGAVEGKDPRERTALESVASSIGGMEQMRQRANEYFESLMQPRGPQDGISPAWLPPTIASRGLAGGITAVFANAMMDSGLKGGMRGLGLTVLVGVFLALTVPTFEDIMCTRDEAKRKEEANSVQKY